MTMWNLPLHIRVGPFRFLNPLTSKQSRNILRNHIWTSATSFHDYFPGESYKNTKRQGQYTLTDDTWKMSWLNDSWLFQAIMQFYICAFISPVLYNLPDDCVHKCSM